MHILRNPSPHTTGLVWHEIKQLWDEGAKAYIQDMWNILDFITNSLYIATFTLKLVAYIRVSIYNIIIIIIIFIY